MIDETSELRSLIREILLEKIVKRGGIYHVMVRRRSGKDRRIVRDKSGAPLWRTAGKHRSYKKARKQLTAIEISKAQHRSLA